MPANTIPDPTVFDISRIRVGRARSERIRKVGLSQLEELLIQIETAHAFGDALRVCELYSAYDEKADELKFGMAMMSARQ